jgi:hypothetical protein
MDLMVLSTRFGRHHYQIVLQMTNVIQITAGVEADIPEGDTDALERSLTFIHQVLVPSRMQRRRHSSRCTTW